MEYLAFGLIITGLVVSVVGGIWFLVVAFQESVLWGLGCLFVPFVSLIFLVLYLGDSWRPFAVSFAGTVVFVLGGLLLGAGQTP